MSYFGSYDLTVDPKGRVVVPVALRDHFRDGGHLALRRNHVALYDPRSWEEFMDRLRDFRDQGRVPAAAFTKLTAFSTPISPDTQGRFAIPQRYREVAEISGNVVIIGTDDHLEIYAPANAPVPEGDDFAALMDLLDGLPL